MIEIRYWAERWNGTVEGPVVQRVSPPATSTIRGKRIKTREAAVSGWTEQRIDRDRDLISYGLLSEGGSSGGDWIVPDTPWTVLLGINGFILLFGGGLLTWVVRRERRAASRSAS